MIEELDRLKSELRSKLLEYMDLKGVKRAAGHNFHCPNKTAHIHGDRAASASFWKDGPEFRFQCHGCGLGYDVFDMASVIDNLPIRGSAFVTKTIPTLCKELGIVFDESKFDEKFRKRISAVKINEKVVEFMIQETAILVRYLTSRNLTMDDARAYLIGHADYLSLYGYLRGNFSEEQIASAGLGYGPDDVRSGLAKQLFHSDRLLFAVCDPGGSPIGFAGRDMLFEEKKKSPHIEDSIPPKYLNTQTTVAYKKSTAMYLFDKALQDAKNIGEILIFEGYTDAVTAHKHGLKNSAALGGVSFSKEHLEVVTENEIRKIVLCLDGDITGQDKTVSIVEKIFKDNQNIVLELITIPDGMDDPDSMIKKSGIDAFKALPRLGMIDYTIQTMFITRKNSSINDDERINMFMQWLAKYTQQPLLRRRAIDSLATILGIPASDLWDQFEYIKSIEDNDIMAKVDQCWNSTYSFGKRMNLSDKIILLDKAQTELFGYTKHSISGNDRDYAQELAEMERNTLDASYQTLKTGLARLDKFVSIPRGGAFIGLGGYPNHGKSAFSRNLAMSIVANNPDSLVIYCSLDDPKSATIPAMVAKIMDIEINQVKYPNSITVPEIKDDIITKIKQGYSNMRRMAVGDLQWNNRQYGQLIVKDASEIVSVIDIRRLVEVMASAKENQGKQIILFVDSLHSFMDVASYGGDIRNNIMDTAQQIKRLSTNYEIPVVSVLEFNKSERSAKKKPTLNSISETIRIEYLLDLGIVVWNELKAMSEFATTFWKDDNGEIYPYLDVDVQKNKLGYFEGSILMKFCPPKNRLKETTIEEQRTILSSEKRKAMD